MRICFEPEKKFWNFQKIISKSCEGELWQFTFLCLSDWNTMANAKFLKFSRKELFTKTNEKLSTLK